MNSITADQSGTHVPNRSVQPFEYTSDIQTSLQSIYRKQRLLTALPILVVDVLTSFTCIALATQFVHLVGLPGTTELWSIVTVLILGTVANFALMGLYDGVGMHPIYEFRQSTMAQGMLYVLIAATLVGRPNSGVFILLFSLPIVVAAIPIARAFARQVLSETSWWGMRCLVFSCDRRVNSLYPNHIKNRGLGTIPVGFMQEELPGHIDEAYKSNYLGTYRAAETVAQSSLSSIALVHRRGRNDGELSAFVEKYLRCFSRIMILPDDHRLPSLWAIGRNGAVSLEDRLLQPSSRVLKRGMDIAVSVAVLTFGFPVFAFIMLWLKFRDPGPMFYGHERIGRGGKKFKAWKFRSMSVNGDAILEKHLAENPDAAAEWEATQKLQNDPRVSAPGRFLRKSSLDELPQIWNILKGEMSLVGPRPIVENEVEKYADTMKSYYRVIPGLTGFWQVSGRNLTTYNRRIELDDYYVRNWSIWFDIYILAKTVKTVLFREGAF